MNGQSTDAADDAVLGQLASLGADYEVVACDPTLADTEAFCAAYGFAAEDSANAIVVLGKSEQRHRLGVAAATHWFMRW